MEEAGLHDEDNAYDAGQLAQAFDLENLPEDFYASPYRHYDALREVAPMKRLANGSVFLTRYADLEQVYRNPKLFSSDKKCDFRPRFGDTPIYEHHTTSLVFNDPPLHTHVRRVLQGALAPKAIAYMKQPLIALVDRLLDQAEARGHLDLVEDFAAAIPIEVIGNLLGVPHTDRGPLRRWSLLILGALEPVVSPGKLVEASAAVVDFLTYLRGLIAERRCALRDPDLDVLSRLILGERNGERLTELQLLHNCIFLLNAGHETTTNFIGNALMTLLENPGEKQRLIEQPGLMPTALEEFLRYESPNQLGNRSVAERCEIGGEVMDPGTSLTLCIGAANRDARKFEKADRLDIGRTPNRHLAFAGGTHLCLGMSLARLEAGTAIAGLLARFPAFALDGELVHSRRARFRGYSRIPVRVG